MSLQKFTVATENILRPTKFRASVIFPAFIGDIEQLRNSCEFLLKDCAIPAKNVGTIEQFWRGRSIKTAGDTTYDDFSCTFINTSDRKLHKAFLRWSEYIDSSVNDSRSPEELSYKSSVITLEKLDNNNNVVGVWFLIGAWPDSVGEIAQDFNSTDTVELFTVNFKIDYFISDII